jgi:hypothetical protein
MHSLVKAACVLQNLSLATAFGGGLFARRAMKPAVIAEITDEKERGRVLAAAWNKYAVRNVPAHIVFTTTWLFERNAILKLHIDRETRKLVSFKDVLITGALLTGIANAVVGQRLQRDYPDGIPVSDRPSTDPQVERYRRFFRVMGNANIAFTGAALAMGPVIVGSILHSMRHSALRRLLHV